MLSEEQVKEAIEQMKVTCDLKMQGYLPVSARSVLYELGYHGENCEQVLQYIYDRGFTYCFDSHFRSEWYDPNKREQVSEYPDPDVCYWGPDQLKSRLECIW